MAKAVSFCSLAKAASFSKRTACRSDSWVLSMDTWSLRS